MLEFITTLAILSLTNSITPGPNNLLLAQIGGNFGFKSGIPYSTGALCGRIIMQISIASTLGIIAIYIYGITTVLKVTGSFYMLYMSFVMFFNSKKSKEGTLKSIPKFKHGFVAQFLNPKAVIGIFTNMSLFFVNSENKVLTLLIIILITGIISFSSGLCWVVFGLKIKSILKSKRSRFIFDIVMFALNILCIFMIWN